MDRRPISPAKRTFVPINRGFESSCSRFQVSFSFLFFLMTSPAKQSEAQSGDAKQVSLCYFQGVWRSGLTAKRPAARRSRSNEGDAPNPVPWTPMRIRARRRARGRTFSCGFAALCLYGEISPSVAFRDSGHALRPADSSARIVVLRNFKRAYHL
jgi:hypothetical protein